MSFTAYRKEFNSHLALLYLHEQIWKTTQRWRKENDLKTKTDKVPVDSDSSK